MLPDGVCEMKNASSVVPETKPIAYERWIPGPVATTKDLGPCVSRESAGTPDVAAEGSCQQTGYRLPHLRHSYWPCDGHIGSACTNLHQRSAIRTWAGFIDLPSLVWRAWFERPPLSRSWGVTPVAGRESLSQVLDVSVSA